MKLLITADAVGGVWQYATDLARALASRGVEPVLALLGPAPTDAQREAAGALRLIETGLPLDWLAETPDEIRAAAQALAGLAADLGVDLVQVNAPALAVARYPVPVVAVAHSCLATWWEAVIGGDMPEDFRWRSDLHAEGLRAADLVVTPSAAFAEATSRAYGPSVRPAVVHNGRAPLPLPQAEPRRFAFTAGRLWDKGKNVATLNEAAASLSFPLHAAGPLSGPNGDGIALQHARALGSLSEPALAAELAARPVFVSAALYEPFGLAVLEAAQAGCPLVLSDIPTFRELWDGAALFVPPRDATAFAAAITRAADEADHLGFKARARAASYTVDAMAVGMLAMLPSPTGRGRGPLGAAEWEGEGDEPRPHSSAATRAPAKVLLSREPDRGSLPLPMGKGWEAAA